MAILAKILDGPYYMVRRGLYPLTKQYTWLHAKHSQSNPSPIHEPTPEHYESGLVFRLYQRSVVARDGNIYLVYFRDEVEAPAQQPIERSDKGGFLSPFKRGRAMKRESEEARK